MQFNTSFMLTAQLNIILGNYALLTHLLSCVANTRFAPKYFTVQKALKYKNKIFEQICLMGDILQFYKANCSKCIS